MKTLLLFLLLTTSAFAQTFHRGGGVEAAPADIAHVQLWNPPGSGVYCKIKRIQVSGHLQGFVIGLGFDPLGSPAFDRPWGIDTARSVSSEVMTFGHCELRIESRPGSQSLGQLDSSRVDGLNSYVWQGELTIGPGVGITIRADRPGTWLASGWSWDEQ